MTLDEASEFWDEHSFLDYDDIKEDLAKQIREIAHQKGTSSRILINQWLKEKVESEQH